SPSMRSTTALSVESPHTTRCSPSAHICPTSTPYCSRSSSARPPGTSPSSTSPGPLPAPQVGGTTPLCSASCASICCTADEPERTSSSSAASASLLASAMAPSGSCVA